MLANFYDIESLANVFTLCNYRPEANMCDIYYLSDDPALVSGPNFKQLLLDRIHECNKNYNGGIELFDLQTESANRHLATTFGLSDAYLINDPESESSYPSEFRLVCDTDPDYDRENAHPYLMGYNSYNYDTTMLALYLYEVFPLMTVSDGCGGAVNTASFMPTNAALLRRYNNELFTPEFKSNMPQRLTQQYDNKRRSWSHPDYSDTRWRIRKSMLLTGRHIDVARLNEKQSKVGLKRLIGLMGGQILESDKLKPGQDMIENQDQLFDLIAYNVSDCVNLKIKIFDHDVYQGQFSLKHGLLQSYPELVYDKLPDKYAPDVRPAAVRRDRLNIDSSSAQLATRALCPYGHLTDIPVVSFMYPSERKAAELGIPRVNVLEESRKFFYRNFPQPELRAEFDKIYNYYKSIEGRNFNESKSYAEDWVNKPEYRPAESTGVLPKTDTCMFYYDGDGNPTSCFVTFSIGGIHGAEYNKVLYEHDCEVFEEELHLMREAQAQYPDPRDLKKAKRITIVHRNGVEEEFTSGKFLKSGSTLKNAIYKDLESKRPALFKRDDDGATKLNPTYTFTSADPTNHEDFTSYYPNMLRMLSAFYNEGLGYDRYAEIFDNKERYGKLMKDKSLPDAERALYAVQREGTKLVLNSASGAADATFESNIRMNNIIISMRIIGQLFSWRIGQAQAMRGAKITSTNTDGLFSVLEAELNNAILEAEARDIHVAIEPEPTFLISKDSNNRIELEMKDGLITGKVEGASGGTLSCRKGPNPTKALAHPAIIDWALTEYLVVASMNQSGFCSDRYKGRDISLSGTFDDNLGMSILLSSKTQFDKIKFLNMFQNVIASSPGSISYIFATKPDAPGVPIIMQHYNRVFIMKDNTPNTVHLFSAVAKALTPAMIQKRQRDNLRTQLHDPVAQSVLNSNGVLMTELPPNKEASVKKVTNIEDSWFMLILNKDLAYLSDEEMDFIIDNLDYEKYLKLLRDGFNQNWRNATPNKPAADNDNAESDVAGTPVEQPVADTQVDAACQIAAPVASDAHDASIKSNATVMAPAATPPLAPESAPVGVSATSGDDTPPWEDAAESGLYASQTACPAPVSPEPAAQPVVKSLHRHAWAVPGQTPVANIPASFVSVDGWPPDDNIYDVIPINRPLTPEQQALADKLTECIALARAIDPASVAALTARPSYQDHIIKMLRLLIDMV